ncbi:single-strand DNA-binding protein [Kineococcus xinjiangensis]|uniref:Single-stranded DNA-binding protein n=1 Tax=Kineococcus xinjiangensis TaxID=512762 RepID=A0A2S6IJ27_9ACTN|nr:single-stranded DNA-binding protein [Kineococcus xinjiangensis]PPK94219.1 single-strand DNA-binding protein [Kineococcus xinjiangensis]
MNEIQVSVTGNVTTDVRHVVVNDTTPITSFRLASTLRRRDGEGRWYDAETTWFTVTCFRSLALNAARSLRKGQPVAVQGRLRVREYEVEGVRRWSLEIEAASVGHDLQYGVGDFQRVSKVERAEPAHREAADALAASFDEVPAAPGEPLPDPARVLVG